MTPAPLKRVQHALWPVRHRETHAEEDSPAVLAAYYPFWKVYRNRKPSDLRLSLLTHVYYAFARLHEDGTVDHRDLEADTQIPVDGTNGLLSALVNGKQTINPQLKLVLSVGGGTGSSHFPSVASDKCKSEHFCITAKAMIDKFGLNGIDIDWEHPKDSSEGRDFAALLVMLRRYLPRPEYVVTVALPANEECLRHIDLSRLVNGSSSVVDHINLMAYDFSGAWSAVSSHHAQLHAPANPKHNFEKQCVANITRYLLVDRKVEARKVVLGLPGYGRSFLGVQGSGERFNGCGGQEGTYEYRDLPLPNSEEIVDLTLGAASCSSGQGKDQCWVTYDNPETVRTKGRFVIGNGLGGVFFWTGASDADQDCRSLVLAAHQALSGAV